MFIFFNRIPCFPIEFLSVYDLIFYLSGQHSLIPVTQCFIISSTWRTAEAHFFPTDVRASIRSKTMKHFPRSKSTIVPKKKMSVWLTDNRR